MASAEGWCSMNAPVLCHGVAGRKGAKVVTVVTGRNQATGVESSFFCGVTTAELNLFSWAYWVVWGGVTRLYKVIALTPIRQLSICGTTVVY